MSPGDLRELAVNLLLGGAVLVSLVSSLALLVMKGFYDKLHYLAPPAVLGTGAVFLAIATTEGVSSSTVKALLVLTVMLVSNPVLTYAAARADYLRRGCQKDD